MQRFGVFLALGALSARSIAADFVVPEHLPDMFAGDSCDVGDTTSLSLRQLRGELRLRAARDADAVDELVQEQVAIQVPSTCGGNADGKQCQFPFRYEGGTYSGCTGVDHTGQWCSTDHDYSGTWASCDCGEAPATPPAPTPALFYDPFIERSLVAYEGNSVGDHSHTDLNTCKTLCLASHDCKSFAWTAGWGGKCHMKERYVIAGDIASHGAHAEAYRTYYIAMPSNSCQNVLGWIDRYGDPCEWYEVDDRCQMHGHQYENSGHTASTACCVCMGYRR